MGWLARLVQPSLARRVLGALAFAFVMVFVVLLLRDYLGYRNEVAKGEALKVGATALAASLLTDDAAEVDVIMRSVEVQYRMLRRDAFERIGMQCPGDVLFQVARHDGQVLFSSAALRTTALVPKMADQAGVNLNGQHYVGVVHETARWRIAMLEPVLNDAELIPALGSQMVIPILISFPIVLLPLWLAVRQGLRPLRVLSEGVARRSAHDFSPLNMEIPHAELRPLVHTINELLARSRQGIARERAVVQDAAHELRTPLAVVATQAHRLLSAPDARTQRTARAALEHAIQRASHMAHQLLTLATFDATEPVATQRVDLTELTRQAVISLNPKAQARRIDITLESPDTLRAAVDTPAYLSVLENLLVNAIHYGHEGGHVLVTLALDGAGLQLTVADDGPGIAPQDRERLFERFHRGRGVTAPGAGLGLAIVKQAVARMGGNIEVHNGIDGRGVAFVVRFAAT